jgi:hypothetical protein
MRKVTSVSVFDGDGRELRHGSGGRVWGSPEIPISYFYMQPRGEDQPYGASPGVPGSEGGGGRLMRVGALVVIVNASRLVVGRGLLGCGVGRK